MIFHIIAAIIRSNRKHLNKGEKIHFNYKLHIPRPSHSRRKCYEKLLQIQFRILRKRNLYPERRLEIVHVHVERGQRHIVLDAKVMFRLREAIPETRTIHIAKHCLFRSTCGAYGNVHFGRYTARDREIGIDVRLDGRITEIDLCEMAILLLGQIERELIVNGQIVVAGSFAWITVIVIGGVALFAMIARQTFGAAIAFGRFVMAVSGLAVALAFLADSAVDRTSPESGFAAFTVGTGREVLAGLKAGMMVGTGAVAIALAARAVREVPPIGLALHFVLGTTIAAWQTLAETRFGTVVTPTACGVVTALSA